MQSIPRQAMRSMEGRKGVEIQMVGMVFAMLIEMRVAGGGGANVELKHEELESKVLKEPKEELVLESGLCSGSFCSLLLGTEFAHGLGSCPCVVAFPESSELTCREGACCIHNELPSVFRDWKGWEDEVRWAEYPSGGWVSWIVSAGNIMGGDSAYLLSHFEEGVNVPENSIDSGVVVPADVPTLDDTCVVTMDFDMVLANEDSVDSRDE